MVDQRKMIEMNNVNYFLWFLMHLVIFPVTLHSMGKTIVSGVKDVNYNKMLLS